MLIGRCSLERLRRGEDDEDEKNGQRPTFLSSQRRPFRNRTAKSTECDFSIFAQPLVGDEGVTGLFGWTPKNDVYDAECDGAISGNDSDDPERLRSGLKVAPA